MEIESLVQVNVIDLQFGMYVAELDRPWLETPFLFQGFKVSDQEEIDKLQELCTYVYVDTTLGIRPTSSMIREDVSLNSADENTAHKLDNKNNLDLALVPIEKEIGVAKKAREELHAVVDNVMSDIQAGKSIQLPELQEAVTPMVDSVLRNSDASMWLAMMKRKDNYTYTHALNVSVLAIKLGRQLGYSAKELKSLAMGAMLFDVGKVKLPPELLQQPRRLTEDEFEIIKRHVDYGIDIVRDTTHTDNTVQHMVQHHHERFNGKGYPNGLMEDQIPIHGRIAAIIDCFDAITTDRVYCDSMSPYHAIEKLYEWRDVDFQAALVEQFIQAIGIYPTGTIVELSTGDIGVIIAQNPVRRLKPKVMLVLNSDKESDGAFPIFDLLTDTTDSKGNELKIIRAHEPGAFGIDPDDFYL